MGYQCYADDQNAPVLLVTNLEAGETMAVCPEHLADYAVGLLQAVTGQTWAPAQGSTPDPETGDQSDEDDASDGVPQTPGPGVTLPPEGAPGPGQDDDEDLDDGDLSDYEDGLGNVVPRSELAQADRA